MLHLLLLLLLLPALLSLPQIAVNRTLAQVRQGMDHAPPTRAAQVAKALGLVAVTLTLDLTVSVASHL